jgi:hypothetical protein
MRAHPDSSAGVAREVARRSAVTPLANWRAAARDLTSAAALVTHPPIRKDNLMDTIPQTSTPAETVRTVQCSLCWAPPDCPCQRQPRANHIHRWLDAYQTGKVDKAALGEALGQVVIITRWQVLLAGHRGVCALPGHEVSRWRRATSPLKIFSTASPCCRR